MRCFPNDSGFAPPRAITALLDRSHERLEAADFRAALLCAEEASRADPRSVEAHLDRATALGRIGRIDEARDAFDRALALDPEDPETLAGAADLFISHLPPSNERSEIGLELARRGSHGIKRARLYNRSLRARLALLEGQALNDLGRSREALLRLDAAEKGALPADLSRARYERALALFELSRFPEAKRGFIEFLSQAPDDAWGHYHLGLTLERLDDRTAAHQEFEAAMRLAPENFKPPMEIPLEEFRQLMWAEVARLPLALAQDLAAVQLEIADLPEIADLTADDPPLSPTIVGLFRGAPLGIPLEPGEYRTIVLYRKNLAREVTSHTDLAQQIRTTLLHELGHLRGEDDDALRSRGLE